MTVAVGVIAVALALVAILGKHKHQQPLHASGPPTTSAASSSTLPASDSTTSATGATVATTVVPPTAPSQPGVITGQGSLFTSPLSPTTRSYNADGGCSGLADAGWTEQCGIVQSALGIIAWVSESRPKQNANLYEKRVLIFKQLDREHWGLALIASDDSGNAIESIRVHSYDLAKDGNSKVVIGVQEAQTGTLDVEVVETTGVVVLHQGIAMGAARAPDGGGIDTWSATPSGGYIHEEIRYAASAWRIVSSENVTSPPPLTPTSPGAV